MLHHWIKVLDLKKLKFKMYGKERTTEKWRRKREREKWRKRGVSESREEVKSIK